MNTPICDFVRDYGERNTLRLHMPGHKGCAFLGIEQLDITEIDGADSLYEADGIIARSEENVSRLFGWNTFYSTEGSSQCIRAMLYLALLHGKKQGRRPLIVAARNVHKTFLSAAALLDLDVTWLYGGSYLSCDVDPKALDGFLDGLPEKPVAVYVTSPDYLGHLADIAGISQVCRKHQVLLLVDGAHGAYLKFLSPSAHPMDLGADLCCASAHKTLPVLTGGAYLHTAECFSAQARQALALFGSTSPSYLILQSLDLANGYLTDYGQKLAVFAAQVEALKERLTAWGYTFYGREPLKLTICTKLYGYTGMELASLLRGENIECEFADPDHVVLMLTPEIEEGELLRLEDALRSIPRRLAIVRQPPRFQKAERVLSIREAMLSSNETVPVALSAGRILAAASVGCPPAVPVLVCGERIDAAAIACFRYYGITSCTVVSE